MRSIHSSHQKPTVNRLFSMHRSYVPCLAVVLVGTSTVMPALAAEPVTETAGARIVCEQGPVTRLARAQRLRGMAAEIEAGVLPNPSLVVEHQRTLSGASEQETIVGLSIPLRLGGRRSALLDAAVARREQGVFE